MRLGLGLEGGALDVMVGVLATGLNVLNACLIVITKQLGHDIALERGCNVVHFMLLGMS